MYKGTSDLRAQAEQRAQLLPAIPTNLSVDEVNEIFHELQVHQIELEMQNEELNNRQLELDSLHSKYFDLYNLAPVGYCTLNDRNVIQEANLTAASLLGMERKLLVGQAISHFIYPADQDIYYQANLQFKKSNNAQVFELRIIRKDKSIVWVQIAASFGTLENTQATHLITLSNISDRKRIELSLQQSELKFRNLVTEMQVGVLLHNSQSQILLCNPKAQELLGLTETQLLGKTWYDTDWNIIREDGTNLPALECPVPQVIATHQAVLGVVMGLYQPLASKPIWLSVSAIPQFNEDGLIHQVICTFSDITLQKTAEAALESLNQQLEERVQQRTHELMETMLTSEKLHAALVIKVKLASLTPLVSAISHEINTPIGNILVLSTALSERSQTLKRSFPDHLTMPDLRNFIEYLESTNQLVLKSAKLAASLILSFKNVAVDRDGAKKHLFILQELAQDCATLVRANFKHSPCELIMDIPSNIQCNSYAGALGQVLENLIRNAYLHGFRKGDEGQISVKAYPENNPDNWIHIEVRDNGIGIAKENIGKIFDPFFTTELGSGGSGLGLSIVYNLVHTVLRGTITAESSVWDDSNPSAFHGTVFHISIPREPQVELTDNCPEP